MAFNVKTSPIIQSSIGNVFSTSSNLTKTMGRLGSGLRVSSAGDDPAAFVGSSRMQDSISSMESVIRTTQENQNYMKTAEGALDEVSKLLRDARSLALNSLNQPTLTDTQRDANNDQLKSISSSITRIARNTKYGTNGILDGSTGIFALSTALLSVESMSFTGAFGGYALSTTATISFTVTTAASVASVNAGQAYGILSVVGAGSFSINGVVFNTTGSTTGQELYSMVNAASDVTGVYVTYSAGAGAQASLVATEWGSAGRIDVVDPNTILISTTNSSTVGTDGVASVCINYNASGEFATVTFNRGTGKTFKDADGNTIELTPNQAVSTTTFNPGQVRLPVGGPTRFQVGINDTTQDQVGLSLDNIQADNLGRTGGNSLSDVDLVSSENASEALTVIDKAINEVSSMRGRIGNFQKNVLDSNMRSLSVGRENMLASKSAIADTDMAAEAAKFAQEQILSEGAVAVLGNAMALSRSALSLIR